MGMAERGNFSYLYFSEKAKKETNVAIKTALNLLSLFQQAVEEGQKVEGCFRLFCACANISGRRELPPLPLLSPVSGRAAVCGAVSHRAWPCCTRTRP